MRGLRRFSLFSLSKRNIKVLLTAFYLIAVPIFVYIGLQPASATDAEAVSQLEIESIGLSTPVVVSELKNHELSVPDRVAGEYAKNDSKTLLIGHSSTVFKNLKAVNLGDEISYQGENYQVTGISKQAKENINMGEILAETSRDTIILMTCSGAPLGHDDYTHRLIITAELN